MKLFNKIEMYKEVIAWWSGGVTSAIACKIAIDLYGKDNTRVIFIDTFNEGDDTYRFLKDCEKWYDIKIETISSNKYNSIQEVWESFNSLNVATGAICSTMLKRKVREDWQKNNQFSYQVFGFDVDEIKRVKSMSLNNKKINPIYPLLLHGLNKKDCIQILQNNNIKIPNMYNLGFHNNNCFKTGCVQGGIGYWKKMQQEYPLKFDAMAEIEHKLTNKAGKPVTMLKDQTKGAKENGINLIFLKPHPQYPQYKDLSMVKGREVKPLLECNGFCGINELEEKSETYNEINYQD